MTLKIRGIVVLAGRILTGWTTWEFSFLKSSRQMRNRNEDLDHSPSLHRALLCLSNEQIPRWSLRESNEREIFSLSHLKRFASLVCVDEFFFADEICRICLSLKLIRSMIGTISIVSNWIAQFFSGTNPVERRKCSIDLRRQSLATAQKVFMHIHCIPAASWPICRSTCVGKSKKRWTGSKKMEVWMVVSKMLNRGHRQPCTPRCHLIWIIMAKNIWKIVAISKDVNLDKTFWGMAPHSTDMTAAGRLWKLSEEIVAKQWSMESYRSRTSVNRTVWNIFLIFVTTMVQMHDIQGNDRIIVSVITQKRGYSWCVKRKFKATQFYLNQSLFLTSTYLWEWWWSKMMFAFVSC